MVIEVEMGLKPAPQQSLLQIQNDFCPQVKAVNLGYLYSHECNMVDENYADLFITFILATF